MTLISIIFLAVAVILVGAIPYVLWKGLRDGKKWSDIFTSTIVMLLLFFISVGEALRPLLTHDAMNLYLQIVLIGFIFVGVIPLLLIVIINMGQENQRWRDPRTYKYHWLYKVRHTIMLLLLLALIFGLYQLFMLFKLIF